MIASNHFVEAEESIDAFLKHTPNSIDAYSLQASVLVKQHRLDAALDSIRQAIAVCPTAAHLYFDLGNILFTKSNFKESIPAFQHSIALDPDNPQAHNHIAGLRGRHLNHFYGGNSLQPPNFHY